MNKETTNRNQEEKGETMKDINTVRTNLTSLPFNFKGKLTAKQQRNIFGKVLFGRKSIRLDSYSYIITVIEMLAFGQDANVYEIPLANFYQANFSI